MTFFIRPQRKMMKMTYTFDYSHTAVVADSCTWGCWMLDLRVQRKLLLGRRTDIDNFVSHYTYKIKYKFEV